MINKLIWVGKSWAFSNSKSPGQDSLRQRTEFLSCLAWYGWPVLNGRHWLNQVLQYKLRGRKNVWRLYQECPSRCGSIVEDHSKILVTHRLARNAVTEEELFFSKNVGKTLRQSQWRVAVCKHLRLWLNAKWAQSLRDCGWASYSNGKVHSWFYKWEACFLEMKW